jgi:uncharacterized protein (TIGR02466 family)
LRDPALGQARTFIQACVQGTLSRLEVETPQQLDVTLYGWININGRGAFNKPHNHPDCLLSGCYYVQVPESVDPTSGQIEFLDPRAGANMVSSPYLAFRPSMGLRPRAGQLLIFPAYLAHWVLPNAEDQDRISIAFNIRLRSHAPAEHPQPSSRREAGSS